MKIKKVGIIGAGQMGNGIAHICSLAGYSVTLVDTSELALDSAKKTIDNNLTRQANKNKISALQKTDALKKIEFSTNLVSIGGVDLVIEAATENFDVKAGLFADIQKYVKADCILATNTSSISISKLASKVRFPDYFIGIHFMNPVPIMKLVEIIPGVVTLKEIVEICKTFVGSLGKVVAVSEDYPGFIANRILMPMINEAVFVLYEGVGDVEAIDSTMKLGMAHPMGPLQLADLIGLDTCLAIINILYEEFRDSKYRACPMLVKYVEAGRLGVKSGRGFYDYS